MILQSWGSHFPILDIGPDSESGFNGLSETTSLDVGIDNLIVVASNADIKQRSVYPLCIVE